MKGPEFRDRLRQENLLQPGAILESDAIAFGDWVSDPNNQVPQAAAFLGNLVNSIRYIPNAEIDKNVLTFRNVINTFIGVPQAQQGKDYVTMAIRPKSSQTWMLDKLNPGSNPDFYFSGNYGKPNVVSNEFVANTLPIVILDDWSISGTQLVTMLEGIINALHSNNPPPIFVGLSAITQQATRAIDDLRAKFGQKLNLTLFVADRAPVPNQLTQNDQAYLRRVSHIANATAVAPIIFGDESVPDNYGFFTKDPHMDQGQPVLLQARRRSYRN